MFGSILSCTVPFNSVTNTREGQESAIKKGRGNLSLHFYIKSILLKMSAPLCNSASYAWPVGVKTLLQAEEISPFKTNVPSLPSLRLAIRL